MLLSTGLPDDLFSKSHVPYPFLRPDDDRIHWVCLGRGHKNDVSCAYACGWFQYGNGLWTIEQIGKHNDPANVAYQLVSEFFEGDDVKTDLWFILPNPMLGDISPGDMISLGRSEKLLRWVVQSLAENPPRVPALQTSGDVSDSSSGFDHSRVEEVIAAQAVEDAKAELAQTLDELQVFKTALAASELSNGIETSEDASGDDE